MLAPDWVSLFHSPSLSRVVRVLAGVSFAAGCALAHAQTYITPTTPGWAFAAETGGLPDTFGAFVNGPAGAPSGSTGSIQLTVGNPGGELFYTQQYAGKLLSQLAGLKYNTYVVSSGIPETANLQFDFDPGQSPPPAGYQGRAVFTPALLPGAVQVGQWQTWDPMTQKAWWGSGPATRVLAAACPMSAPCTWTQIKGLFPNASILAAPSAFGFKVGNSASAATVSVDSFTIGTAGAAGPVTQYNFALAAPVAYTPVPAVSNLNLLLLAVVSGLAGFVALRRRS